MKLNEYLTNRLKEIFTEGKWVVGTNFKEQIYDLDWNKAIQKVEDFNTIADLTFHLHYYIAGVTKVLEGGTLDIKDKFSFDSPPIKSEQDWRNLVKRFCSDSEKFINLVENMTDEKLKDNFVDEKYGTYYRNIDAMIEHTYYHLGQIILIKKRLKNENPNK
ncbi:DinB family protein [Pseudotamlana agarivorans]|uniref:DinB family protein n=1 Tax=Pseudotamlana agarivorans TaxID=481183 RepID=UPI00082FE717|nr:DinB family protein [Tamlana agarivorans]